MGPNGGHTGRVVAAARWVQGGAGHGQEEGSFLFSSQGGACLSASMETPHRPGLSQVDS